jgi:hypothetical protein
VCLYQVKQGLLLVMMLLLVLLVLLLHRPEQQAAYSKRAMSNAPRQLQASMHMRTAVAVIYDNALRASHCRVNVVYVDGTDV